ncbi:MAG: trypsin-like peptidase domain-containing protein [Chloroflexi bacterium]|nr:trypsin-like peptidase domain-containing protein [Chloroflexota bacterium]
MGLLASARTRGPRWAVLPILLAAVLAATSVLALPREAGAQIPATEIFARVSPAVPVIETPRGHGTGFMLDANHVMTVAHAVEDFETVKVRFPGGATYGTAKVVARDRLADMAIIEIAGTREVVTTIAEPPTVVGSELYVLGYPGRTANSPQPLISRGLLSQISRWDTMGITYLRTDASGEPGTSGGPLLDADGNVVGVIQFGSPTGAYMIAASAADLKARALRHLAGEDVDGIARRVPSGPAGQSFIADLTGATGPEASFFVTPSAATGAEFLVAAPDAQGPVTVSVYSARGQWLTGSVLNAGRTSATLLADLSADQRYWISFSSDRPARITLQSSVTLARFADTDDRRMVAGRVIGMIDHANDMDCRPIALRAGQKVTTRAESVTSDLALYLVSPGGALVTSDSDSADGVRGGDAEASATAASSGDYVVCVSAEIPVSQASGYVLTVTATAPPALGDESGSFTLSQARLAVPRRSNATIGLPDGRALAIGGLDADDRYLAAAEAYDPAADRVTPAGRDVIARRDPTAVLLQDGRVLVIGGISADGVSDAASVYHPHERTWTSVGRMSLPRIGAEATVLQDGRVLIASGGDRFGPTAAAEIFDPATGRFATTGSMTVERSGLIATRLPDGRVLFAGGVDVTQQVNGTAELYDPATGRFTETGALKTPRYNHNSTLLRSGLVLITGGTTVWEDLASAELYDPATGTFRETGSMRFPRQAHSATLLPNGRVLIASGAYTAGVLRSLIVEVGAAELYDEPSGTFLPAGALQVGRGQFGALLPDGTVVFMGGTTDAGALDSIESYTPGTAGPVGAGGFVEAPVFSANGIALAIFRGGSVDQLEAAARAAGASGVWVQDDRGIAQLLVVDGPPFLSQAFRAAFADGLAPSTPATLTK